MPRSIGSKLRGEAELPLFESAGQQHFRHVPVLQDRVSRKVLRGLAKAGLERRLAAGAADAALGVADDPGVAVDDARRDQRANGEIGRRRIAAGIRNEPRFADAFAAIFRQSVRRFGEQRGRGVVFLVPLFVAFGSAQAEGAAEIDHGRAGVEKLRREVHRNLGRSGQQNGLQAFRATDSAVAGARRMVDLRSSLGVIAGVGAMFRRTGSQCGWQRVTEPLPLRCSP